MKADGKNAVADGKVNNKPDSGISGIGGSGLKHETQTRNEPPALLSVRPLAEGRMGTEAEASTRKTSESSGNSQMFDAKQIPEKASKSKLKETPKIRIPSFLAKHMERSAAYSRYFIPAYTRLSKILSKSVGEYALSRFHIKIQKEIKRLEDFSDERAVRDDLLAKYIRQFSLHILEYEARARANLHNKHAEMKAVTAEDINYLVNSFEFHPWDKD